MKKATHNYGKNRRTKISLAALLLVLSICLCMLTACSFKFNDGNTGTDNLAKLIVHYLDVGQGDSIFIELPNSQTMLIDAGVKNCGDGIKDYINSKGYSKIDYLVATHPHADHIGSMADVVKNMDIGKIYMPKVSTTTKTYEKLLTAISDKGLKIQSAQSGMKIVKNETYTVDILAPVTIDEENLNNCSVIIKIVYNNNSFLFIGDAEKEELATVTADMSADVLKVGHHGSRTSTTKDFLKKVEPKIGVISLGKDNDYGHPHKEALNLLEEFNVRIYRTDNDGTITVDSDGNNINVETEKISMLKDN